MSRYKRAYVERLKSEGFLPSETPGVIPVWVDLRDLATGNSPPVDAPVSDDKSNPSV